MGWPRGNYDPADSADNGGRDNNDNMMDLNLRAARRTHVRRRDAAVRGFALRDAPPCSASEAE